TALQHRAEVQAVERRRAVDARWLTQVRERLTKPRTAFGFVFDSGETHEGIEGNRATTHVSGKLWSSIWRSSNWTPMHAGFAIGCRCVLAPCTARSPSVAIGPIPRHGSLCPGCARVCKRHYR